MLLCTRTVTLTTCCVLTSAAFAQTFDYTIRTGSAFYQAGWFPPVSSNPSWNTPTVTHYDNPIDLGYASARFRLDAEPSPTSIRLHVLGSAARSVVVPSVPQAYTNGTDTWRFTLSQPACFSLQGYLASAATVTTAPLPSIFFNLGVSQPGIISLSNGTFHSTLTNSVQGTQALTINYTGTLSAGTYYFNSGQSASCNGVFTAGTEADLTLTIGPPAQNGPVADAAACPGSDASFTIATTGVTTGYQWQCSSTSTGGFFQNISDGPLPGFTGSASTASGTATPTLTIHAIDSAAGRLYRCVASNFCGTLDSNSATLLVLSPADPSCGGVVCDSIDFNNDGLFPDTADIDDFLSVFSGGPCSTAPVPGCSDIDFNNDGLFPDTQDIDSLLSVFSGGPCL